MKKIYYGFILVIILLFVINITVNNSKSEKEEIQNETFMMAQTLDDGRTVFYSINVPYINNSNNSLSDAFTYNEITIEEFLKKLDYVYTLRDGGSILYKYNTISMEFGYEEFYVISCNSVDNINDIYVARRKESLNSLCSIKINDLYGVSMKIKEGTLTRTGATVIIIDKSGKDNIYGQPFKIEKKVDGIWIELESKNDMFFTMIGYKVDKNYTLELSTEWEYFYGALENGEYRIIKGTREPGEGTGHYITAEFVIK